MALALLSLPTEILLLIFQYIPIVSQHSLSLSCQCLHRALEPYCPALNLEASYQLRTYLARDGFLFRHHAYCGSCRSLHLLSHFADGQLERAPVSRVCVMKSQQLWLGPGRFHSLHDLRQREQISAIPNLSRLSRASVVIRLSPKESLFSLVQQPSIFKPPPPEQYAIGAQYEIISFPNTGYISRDKIEGSLQGFNLLTCPHIWLSDSLVTNSYHPTRHLRLESIESLHIWVKQCETEEGDACCQFPGCQTFFRWATHPCPNRNEWSVLSIYVKRYLGNLNSPSHPSWLSQGVTIPSVHRLEAYWADCIGWKNVNMAIEEKMFEREQIEPYRTLSEGERVEYELLKRENDHLRHPRRQIKYPEPYPNSLSAIQGHQHPLGHSSSTATLLQCSTLTSAEGANAKGPRNVMINQTVSTKIESGDQNGSSCTAPDIVFDRALITPRYDRQVVVESMKHSVKFDRLFAQIHKEPTFFQHKVRNIKRIFEPIY